MFAELLLFVLVGAQVNVKVAWHAGLTGTLVIWVGLLFRSVGNYISLMGTSLNLKEKIFCVIAYIPKATVQAAIGAVPLAAGVASGEVILAVAVLSILLTAPIGAIGIIISGEKILDYGEKSPYKFKDLREKHGLPRVGERVRSKHFGTVWKIIEEKEIWMEAPNKQLIPGIFVNYWREDTTSGPGTGKTMSYRYSQNDPPFDNYWEILYDWQEFFFILLEIEAQLGKAAIFENPLTDSVSVGQNYK